MRAGPNSLSFASLSAYHIIYTVDKVFEKGSFYDFARNPYTGLGSIFSARTAADLRDHRRKVLNGAFSGSSLAGYQPLISKHATALVREMDLQTQQSTQVNISPLIQVFTTNLNFELIHGLSISDLSTKAQLGVLHGLSTVSKFSFGFSYLPLLGWIVASRPGRRILRKPKLDPVTKEPIEMAALFARSADAVWRRDDEISAPDAQPSFLKAWLTASKPEVKMDKEQIAAESLNLVFAGRGSTATALTLILHKLGSESGRPWQDRIWKELVAATRQDQMGPILTAVVKETLRLEPPFPRGFPREVGPGAVVVMPGTDRPLPSGTEVWSSSYVLARLPDIWGPDAAEWKPERWLQGDDKGSEDDAGSLESRFLVFGKGARGCIGRDIAMTTILEVISLVLRRWQVSSEVDEMEGSVDWEMRYDVCHVTLTERAIAA